MRKKLLIILIISLSLLVGSAFGTITNTIQPPKQYTSNGITTNFPIPFDYIDDSDLTVSFVNDSDGSVDSWVQDAIGDQGYTIVNDEVVANSAPDDGTLVIDGETELTQELDLKNNRATPAELYEAALDKATLQARDNKAIIDRAMVAPSTSDPDIDYTAPDYSASSYWQWHPTEKKLRNATISGTTNTIGTDVGDLVILIDVGGSPGWPVLKADNLTVAGEPLSDISQVLVGSGLVWFGATPPSGYLECDGSAISRTTYSNLFSVYGTTYGIGDGSTTFNIPDLRGYFLRGWDHGAGVDPDAAIRTDRGDGTDGDNIGTKQAEDLLSHDHDISSGLRTSPGTNSEMSVIDSGSNPTTDTGSIQSTGGNGTWPINANVMFCIKY